MKEQKYTISGLTLAITHMDAMLGFYSQVFQIQFEEEQMFGTILYSGNWGGLNLLFCPAELAGNTATENRHQFDIIVPDLSQTIAEALLHGGMQLGEISEDENTLRVGMYDPDKNTIVFKQLK